MMKLEKLYSDEEPVEVKPHEPTMHPFHPHVPTASITRIVPSTPCC